MRESAIACRASKNARVVGWGTWVASFLVLMASAVALPTGFVVAQDEPADDATPIRIGILLLSADASGDADAAEGTLRDAARQGIEMATEELGFNAELLDFDLTVDVLDVDGPEAAAEAARRLVAEGVLALAGGYGEGVAAAIAEVADSAGVPFLNIGSPSIALRNEQCSPLTFHVEPSAGMYVDALAGWYVGAGFRDWHLITDGSDEAAAIGDRLQRTLRERHFGARIAGRSEATDDASIDAALDTARGADVILIIARGADQLRILERAEAAGIDTEITAFPWPETQTRAYYAAALEVAPTAGAGHRASAWEPTLDAYGARELNVRYQSRYGEPMDAPAWAGYQAVKLPYEAVTSGGARDAAGVAAHFTAEGSVFDVWKGIGVTFRPWNHQLRQTLFLVELQPGADDPREAALLVGELPAIYMPRTDPVERLDQLGDLRQASRCSF